MQIRIGFILASTLCALLAIVVVGQEGYAIATGHTLGFFGTAWAWGYLPAITRAI